MTVSTYTAKAERRQFRFWMHCLLLSGLATSLAACGSFGGPVGSDDLVAPLDLTGSIEGTQNPADADIGQGDRSAIAFALAAGPTSVAKSPAFTWSNPVSGNSGTIISATKEPVTIGTECTRFETTANTIAGVRAYEGLACRDAKTNWTIVELKQKSEQAAATPS
ncbi:pyridoxamine 5'-phosphate oxidase [Stappia sp. F7233]|uniref:Pyridoxamine 5'-phosphate oxidase n=1 Tax=Stappia albiluteola TaxID=2758565 RepID=A0A839ABC9_9HYPH|nr:RT0821/Lpp0805 family surface protein [Stappia albiluteola]MBA5776348.1 pyridoxamine 5'-phosphate oxidase [Stappia albiluteola]